MTIQDVINSLLEVAANSSEGLATEVFMEHREGQKFEINDVGIQDDSEGVYISLS